MPLKNWIGRKDDPNLAQLLRADWATFYSPKNLGCGNPRNHESYLVSVPGKLKGFLYWPIVSKLRNDSEIEILAAYAHKAWCGWMTYMFLHERVSASTDGEGSLIIPAELVSRWARQMNTPYEDLPESEKESDRAEARKILDLLGLYVDF